MKAATVSEAVDDRFETFISDILPPFKDSTMKHTLIYVPSYFDFVRLRNYLKKEEYKFVHICEYTEVGSTLENVVAADIIHLQQLYCNYISYLT